MNSNKLSAFICFYGSKLGLKGLFAQIRLSKIYIQESLQSLRSQSLLLDSQLSPGGKSTKEVRISSELSICKEFKNILMLLTLLSLAPISTVYAATLKVPEKYSTIADAVSAASSGDQILVGPGIYKERNISINKKNIKIMSHFSISRDRQFIEKTVLNGGGKTFFTVEERDGEGFELIGFKVINCYKPVVIHDKAIIRDNHFFDNGADTISFEAKGYGEVIDNKIELSSDDGIDIDSRRPGGYFKIIRNTVLNCGDDGMEIRLHTFKGAALNYEIVDNIFSGHDEDGIQLIDYPDDSPREFIIQGNILANNVDAGLGCTEDGNTIEDLKGSPLSEKIFLINNTLVNNKVGATGGKNMISLNNIIANNSIAGIKNANGNSIIDHSAFYNNGTDIVNSPKGSNILVNTNPGYDPLTFSLQTGSPLIDKGVKTYTFKGQSVFNAQPGSYQGVGPDIGALEVNDGKPLPMVNLAPQVSAGRTRSTTDGQIQMQGTIKDDGLPNGKTESTWSLIDGPGNVRFSDSRNLQTTLTLENQGLYKFRLTGTDGDLSASDEVIIRYLSEEKNNKVLINSAKSNYIGAQSYSYSYNGLRDVHDNISMGAAVQTIKNGEFFSSAEYLLSFTEIEETYFFHIRVKSLNGARGDFEVKVKDEPSVQLSVSSQNYTWIKVPGNFLLSAGNWPFIIEAKDAGLVWDSIAVSKDASFTPSDLATPSPVVKVVELTISRGADDAVETSDGLMVEKNNLLQMISQFFLE